MVKVHILTPQTPWSRGFNDFYPLLKWNRSFKKKGIFFHYFNSHLQKHIFAADLLIVDYRYYQYIGKGKYEVAGFDGGGGDDFIRDFLTKAQHQKCRLVLFDTGDSGGSATFHITPYVDIHLKKQILKDRSLYLEKKKYNLMPWLPGKIEESRHLVFTPLLPEDEYKLRVAWNIGLCDYRWFPHKKKFPVGSSGLLNRFYKRISVKKPSQQRTYLLSYRGSSNKFESYDYQRNLLKEKLETLNLSNAIIGGKVAFRQYMHEQEQSKITLSPFGWGEICYRDFEAFINGTLLVKPSVEHLVTFPDLYKPHETYAPVKWDLSDLDTVICQVEESERWIDMAFEGQKRFLYFQNSFQEFFQHFERTVLS